MTDEAQPEDLPLGAWRTTGSEADAEQTAEQLRALRELVRQLGHEVKPGSRVSIFERSFSRFLDPHYDPRRDADFDPATFAHGARDLNELLFICEMLRQSHEGKLRDAVPTLLSGSVAPSKARSQAPRDLQFELFVAAQLIHSGFRIALDEPDMVFALDEVPIGVAAKRLTSGGQFVKRIKEGIKQIDRSGKDGLVAVSLDRLLPQDAYVVAKEPEALDDAATKLLRSVFEPLAREAHETLRATKVTGLMVSMCAVGCVKFPWQPAHTTATWWFPRDNDLVHESRTVQRVVSALRAPCDAGGWARP